MGLFSDEGGVSNAHDDRQPDERTAEVVRQIANSVTGMLVWTAVGNYLFQI